MQRIRSRVYTQRHSGELIVQIALMLQFLGAGLGNTEGIAVLHAVRDISLYQMIKNRINEAKVGVLKVHGNYSIVCGDPYSLCQHIFGLDVTGILGENRRSCRCEPG